jgi:hypothetical protein
MQSSALGQATLTSFDLRSSAQRNRIGAGREVERVHPLGKVGQLFLFFLCLLLIIIYYFDQS